MQDAHALQIQMRKDQDTLKIAGLGVMAFGVWSIIKTVMHSFLQWNSIAPQTADSGVEESLVKAVYIIMLFILTGIEIALRMYIGRSAIAEGKGKKNGWGYVVLAFFIVAMNAGILILSLVTKDLLYDSVAESGISLGVSFAVEFSSVFLMLEMCFSSIRVKKTQRQLAEQR